VTAIQQAALRYYASQTRTGREPAVATQRALTRKGLIRDRQATDAEKLALGRPTDQPWRITVLTGDGQLLIGEGVDTTPSADPFTGMPDDDADPFTTESDRRF
jgi:hypothetical protein